MLRSAFLLCLILALASVAVAHPHESGFLNRTISVNGETYRFQVFVPENWDRNAKWPVILFLHGAGERGDDGILQTDIGFGHAIRQDASRWPAVVVMPQCRRDKLWVDADMQAQALAALDQSVHEFHGDRSRLYLTGLSMGGYGSWEMAAKHAKVFAAVVVICGGIHSPPTYPPLRVSLVTDRKVTDPYAETARRIGQTPVWIFHGGADDTVPVEESRKMAAALKDVGANFRYTEYPGVSHNSWDQAYAEPGLTAWLFSQRLH